MIAAQPGWPAFVNTLQMLAISKMASAQMITQTIGLICDPVVVKLPCGTAPPRGKGRPKIML